VPVLTNPAQGGQQVGPECIRGAAATPRDFQQLVKCLGYDLVDFLDCPDKITGKPASGLLMPLIKNLVRRGLPRAHPVKKFRVICAQHGALFVAHLLPPPRFTY
jgi:hypothetical protein